MKVKSEILLRGSVVLAIFLSAVCAALADMEIAPLAENNANNEARPWRRAGLNERVTGENPGERLIDRLLGNAKLTTELGLSEETVLKLREEARQNQNRKIDLTAQISKLSLEQSDRMATLLADADEKKAQEVMRLVEEIGRLRIEQAKLEIQQLLVIRKYLTPEQIRKARELIRARLQNNAGTRHEKVDVRPGNK